MTTASGFNAIVGQSDAIRLLKIVVRNGKLPHAMLFTGDDGVGKKMTAMAVAMACNCLTLKSALGHSTPIEAIDSCGGCAPCRKITGNHHPDVIRVAPHSSVIRIAQIRTLLQSLSLKPHEADRRVVVLSDAQAMNPEASNALLKALEEPPDRTLIILTARQTTDLLPTIVSRCQHIRFSPLGVTEVKQLLVASDGLDEKSASTLACLCGGSYARAQQRTNRRWLSRREWIILALGKLITSSGEMDLRAWLAFSEMISKQKDLVEESLEIITMWLRDVLVMACDPQRVLNKDRLEALSVAAQQVSQQCLLQQIDAVDRATRSLQSNTNVRLTLDAMALQMAAACCTYK